MAIVGLNHFTVLTHDLEACKAFYIGLLGLDFHLTGPPELVEQVRAVGERYRNAVPS